MQWRACIGTFRVTCTYRSCPNSFGKMTKLKPDVIFPLQILLCFLTYIKGLTFILIIQEMCYVPFHALSFILFVCAGWILLSIPILYIWSIMQALYQVSRHTVKPKSKLFLCIGTLFMVPGLASYLLLCSNVIIRLIIILANDIEVNPGPRYQETNILSCNINGKIADGENSPRFVELGLTAKLQNCQIISVCEAGKNLDLDKLMIDGFHKPYQPQNFQGRGILMYVDE
ncbi:unnamed protein product, partial [Owenia fusiformis]